MEGYVQDPNVAAFRYAAPNAVVYVPVTDATATPRRTVVNRDKCDSCHGDLTAHGGTVKSVEYCVMCHTPNAVNAGGAPRFEVPTTTAPSVSFKVLVHKIHRGNQLAQGYVLGGDPQPTASSPGGTPIDFGKVAYPGNLRACWACHASTSYELPLPVGQIPTKTSQVLACNDATLDPSAYCASRSVQSETFLAPTAAACTACHDDASSVAHAQVNVAADGSEACATCHGPGQAWDVQSVHVLPP
jgi:OmcA/MtrC family decaheme c-type cytochrome